MYLRPATQADAAILFSWRNDVETRRTSINQAEVPWENHLRWLTSVLEDPQRKLYVFQYDEQSPLGTGRADYDGNRYELSWTVSPEQRGKGIGKALVVALLKIHRPALAKVKNDNPASMRIAEAVGFRQVDDTEGLITYHAD